MLRSITAALLALTALPAAAQTDEQKAQIALSLQRGAMIYAYDQAAWHGTDDMLAKLKDANDKVGGWIVDGPAEATELVFFDKSGTQAIYAASFRDNKLVSGRVIESGEALSPERRAKVTALNAARAKVIAEKLRPCTPAAFNTVVLPPERAGGPTLVYFLSSQVQAGQFPMGGHYLIEVAPDGTAGAPRPFTNSCLNMDRPQEAEGRPAMLFVTHLRDLVPTEIHVFTSYTAGLPVAVGTSDRWVWAVERNKIARVQRLKD